MKKMLQAAVVAAAVLAVPSMSMAAQTKPAPAAKSTAKKTASAATHSAKGVVKSMDATSVVVTEKGKDVTYALDASTKKEGDPAVGSTVTVTYKAEGTSMVATDVKAAPAKAAKTATHAAKK
jgi:hypothetical protein